MSRASLPERRLAIAVEMCIDQCCGRFENAWAAGEIPDIRDAFDAAALDASDAAARRTLLVELALVDLEYRLRPGANGDRPDRWRVEDYTSRWPELLDAAGNPPIELVRQEFRVRRLIGETPERSEYAARFPGLADLDGALTVVERRTPSWMQSITRSARRGESQAASTGLTVRCPHCRDAVTVVADSPLSDISCAACGRTFSLLGENRDDKAAPPLAAVAHFEFLERLGVGGFGTVWRARDTRLDRLVAVKIPRKVGLDSAEAQQFLREARSAAQLRHPNIVPVHEVGREGDTIYIVSDYIRGKSLAKRLEAGPFSQRDAAAIAAKLADALAHAHAAGVVHRDLKPANVMLDEVGEPHVMDFGLAKRDAGEVTMTVDGNILGTPAYMPPEQARGEGHRADARSDVYSLGVMLFEMLTGELPFRGSTQMLIAQILGDDAPSPRKLDRNISRDLETICLKCLEKEPARRYATASDLAEELRLYLRGEPILARPIARTERAWRWCRRRPMVAGLGGTLAAVVLAVAIVAPIVAAYQGRLRADAETLAGQLDVSLDEAKSLNDDLSKAIGEKDRQFRRANALRLAAQAKSLAEESPQLGVLLAAAALENSRGLGESATETRQSLYDVLSTVSGAGISGHTAAITTVDGLANGSTWASGDRTGNVRIWWQDRELRTDLEHAVFEPVVSGVELPAFEKDVVDVRWMVDNWYFVAAASDGTVRVFESGKEEFQRPIREWKCGAPLRAIAVGGYDWIAAACEDGNVRLLEVKGDVGDEPRLLECGENPLRAVAVRPMGDLLAAAGDDRAVYVWNLNAPDRETPLKLVGHEGVVRRLCFSADGRWLASCGNDASVRVWNTDAMGVDEGNFAAQAPAVLAGHGGAVRDAVFSADGKMLASAGSDGVVRVWGLSESGWVPRHTLTGHTSIVRAVRFSPDGTRLVSASEDRTVRVWKLDASRPERSSLVLRGHERGVVDVAFAGGGRQLVSGSIDASLRFYDDVDLVGAGATMPTHHPSPVRGVCFFGYGGEHVASGTFDGKLYLSWPFSNAGYSFEAMDAKHSAAITQMAASADGWLLAAASVDGRVSVWPRADGLSADAAPIFVKHVEHVSGIAFHPDGRSFATASYDGVLRRWSLTDDGTPQEYILRKGRRPLLAVAVDPLGRWVATADERGRIEFAPFDGAATGTQSSTPLPAPIVGRAMITSLAISPEGRWLFAGDFQGAIRRWDLQAGIGKRPDVLRGHEKAVTSLSVSPDGQTLLSAGPDGMARLWDLASPRPAATGIVLRGHGSAVFAAAISPDGRFAATACDDRFVRFWHLRADELLGHARRVAGRALSAEERRTYQVDAPQSP
ncbi:MAG: hypothetical protein DCC68_13430 [Planctomycetota bacterium]|nr:MAG: hypothetical protein DCC68_13430 [Planctomycetota bacterium]